MARLVVCDSCGHRSATVRVRERTDPRTYRATRRALCDTCGRRDRFLPVSYDRPLMAAHGRQAPPINITRGGDR